MSGKHNGEIDVQRIKSKLSDCIESSTPVCFQEMKPALIGIHPSGPQRGNPDSTTVSQFWLNQNHPRFNL